MQPKCTYNHTHQISVILEVKLTTIPCSIYKPLCGEAEQNDERWGTLKAVGHPCITSMFPSVILEKIATEWDRQHRCRSKGWWACWTIERYTQVSHKRYNNKMFEKQHNTMISPYWPVRPTPIRLIIWTMRQYHLHEILSINQPNCWWDCWPIMAERKMPTNSD